MGTLPRTRLLFLIAAMFSLLALAACGGGKAGGSSDSGPVSSGGVGASSVPVVQHVAIVVLENQNYSVVTDGSSMPYFMSLTQQGGLATNYFGSSQPSLPNYFALTTGQTLVTQDSSPVQSVDNVVRVLTGAGKSWKGYFQSLPSTGYMGLDVPPYVKHHNPFAYLSDVVNDSAQQQHVVPLSALSTDASANQLPDFMFIVPDSANGGGECPDGSTTSCTNQARGGVADAWLKSTVATVMSSTAFQQSGVLIVVWDNANQADTTNGGGHVAMLIMGTNVRPGYKSATLLQHPSTLHSALLALGVSAAPGNAAGATDFREFFKP